jgi:hypothetical protein
MGKFVEEIVILFMIVTPMYYWYVHKTAAELHLLMCNRWPAFLCSEMMDSAKIKLFSNKQYKLRLELIV